MPILPRERSLLPDDMFADDRVRYRGSRWSVIHTRPRAEKALARHLSRDGTPFFLPLFQKVSRQQRRTIETWLPLFPGYVFILADREQLSAVFMTNLVANCLAVDDQQRLRNDLKCVHNLIESGASLSPEERLQQGMEAEIIAGPLKGHRGIVLRRRSGLRFVLQVNFLQQGASIEVDGSLIRQI